MNYGNMLQWRHEVLTEIEQHETIEAIKQRLEPDSGRSTNITTTPSPSLEDTDKKLDTENTAEIPTLKLSIQTEKQNVPQVNVTDTYRETYNENESGFSWGEKISHDETWEERWLQQKLKKIEAGARPGQTQHVDVVFGRSSGIDTSLQQRWTATWETKTYEDHSIKTVKKVVQKFDSSSMDNILEEWKEELITETKKPGNSEDWNRIEKVQRVGFDKQAQRQWKETTCETFYSPKDKENNLLSTESTFVEEFEERFIETEVTTYHKRSRNRSNETFSETKKISKDEKGQLVVEVVDKETHTESLGKLLSKESETTSDGTYRCREITFLDNSKNQIYEKITSPNGNIVETLETPENGKIYRYRKEHILNQDTQHRETLIENKSWSDSDGTLKTFEKTVQFDKDDTMVESTEKHWEKFFDKEELRITHTKYQKDDIENSFCASEEGYSREKFFETNAETGHRWTFTYKPKKLEGVSKSSAGQLNHELKTTYNDKWWKESSGNSWGEKKYVDLEANVEKNEKWYDNGIEKQVDRWEIDKDGRRHGEKFGSNDNDLCEWNEKWSKTDESANDYSIDKSWKKHYNDTQTSVRWGFVEGRQGEQQWKQKWEEQHNTTTNTGSRFCEKWDNDGLGNSKTCKEGNSWESGSDIDWFYDTYGECFNCSEKWAYKRGKNCAGDVWMEKWNETPQQLTAEKEGKNNFGDEWHEIWKEGRENEVRVNTWASKSGKNNRGDEWHETWFEDQSQKYAKKTGKNFYEEWQEEWGEQNDSNGSGQKWTSKWTQDKTTGSKRGQNWGDSWGEKGHHGHHWDEKWNDFDITRSSYDTPGRPEGC